LEIAKAFQRLPARPRRSILFVAMTGEEQGKLGSDYFASFPPVPRSALVAAVNIDGSIGSFPVRDAIVFGQAHSSLGRTAEQAGAECGFIISPEPQPERGLFVRSDHFCFVRAGVPGVFLSPGYRSSDPGIDGLKAYFEWAMSAYHMPGDDARRTFDYVTGAKFARFTGMLGYLVAMETGRPAWAEGDFFGRKFGQGR
jgi:Zn-dependent M28 family amino/carboxypeptidase